MAADPIWIISHHGDFLERFGFNRDKIMTEYETWKINYPDYTTTSHFFSELLRQATLYNIKHADTEEEYANINIAINSRELEFCGPHSPEKRYHLVQLLHFNKLMISRLSLPFKFDVQIKTDNCCSYCNKQNNRIYSLDKAIEKKYLPHLRCKNEGGCKCYYSIVPYSMYKGILASKPTKTAPNKGFSAMLAAEHILIDISLISCSPHLYEHNRALEYTISFLSLISNSTGLK